MEANTNLSESIDSRHLAAQTRVDPRHIPVLDGIRGLAILLVTIYRFNGGFDGVGVSDSFVFRLATIGFRGVDLFFVLSGFLITGILLDSKGQPNYLRNFYARRALRIFPLYYGALALALIILPMFSDTAASVFSEARQHQSWLWLYGTNVLQSLLGEWPFGCFNHFWSLAVEEHFYFVWPFVILFASQRTAIATCVGTICLSLAARVTWLVLGGNDVAPEVFTLFRADALAIGALMALLIRQPNDRKRLESWSRSAGYLLALALTIVTISNRRWLTIPDTFFAAMFGCMIVSVVSAPKSALVSRFFGSKFLRFFGKYSYGMYVFQYPLIPILAPFLSVELLSRTLGNSSAGRIAYIILMTTVTTGLAIMSWYLFERHFLSLKYLFPSRSPRQVKS